MKASQQPLKGPLTQKQLDEYLKSFNYLVKKKYDKVVRMIEMQGFPSGSHVAARIAVVLAAQEQQPLLKEHRELLKELERLI
jgi:hypothetical protein